MPHPLHASRSLLCIRFVAVAFWSEEEVSWRRGPPWPIFAPPWICSLADLAELEWGCPNGTKYPPRQPILNRTILPNSARVYRRTDRQTDGRTGWFQYTPPNFVAGGYKNNNTCKEPWVLHAYQVSSKSIKRFWRRSWKCESLRTTTDGVLWQ